MGWIGVDLDGTLAMHGGGAVGEIGAPIPAMVDRVKAWLAEGREVRIFTARVSGPSDLADEQRGLVAVWCLEHLGAILAVTNEKDYGMVSLYDDRCVAVETNTGRLMWAPRVIQGGRRE